MKSLIAQIIIHSQSISAERSDYKALCQLFDQRCYEMLTSPESLRLDPDVCWPRSHHTAACQPRLCRPTLDSHSCDTAFLPFRLLKELRKFPRHLAKVFASCQFREMCMKILGLCVFFESFITIHPSQEER